MKLTIKESMEILEQGLLSLQSNEDWKRYLKFQSTFYNYSFNNVMLILSQMPTATYVMSYKKWKELGREVKKKETSLKIYAPTFKKRIIKDKVVDDEKKTLTGFILVPVFDISQTEGEEIITESKIEATLKDSGCSSEKIIEYIESIIDIPIIYFDDEKLSCYYSKEDKEIGIRSDLPINILAYSLVREFSKYQLETSKVINPKLNEIIIESVSFIVCNSLGLDTSSISFPLVSKWSEGNVEIIKEVGTIIQKNANFILTKIKEEMEEAA